VNSSEVNDVTRTNSKGGFMKRGKVQNVFVVCMFILAVFSILPGCGKGIFGGGSWDKPVPTVSSTDPANGSTLVAIGNSLSVTFSSEMNPSTITTATFTVKQEGGTPVLGIVTYSGVTAVFTPTGSLATNTRFTGTITTGAKAYSGMSLASDYVWTFTTGASLDTTAPTVTGTVNANGATNVAVNTKIGATFSEAMDPATITGATYTVKETVSGTAVAGAVSYSGVSAAFTPSSNLAFTTRYTVTVKGGVNGAKDLAGNPLANDFVISWTTGAAADTTAPTVTGTIHTNGATNVAVNTAVGATFSEPMDHLTITNVTVSLKEAVSGTTVPGTVNYSGVSALFVPTNNLTFSTRYTVTVKGGSNGAKDLAGNPVASDFVISWTTGVAPDITAPTVTGTINANGATNVTINTNVGATFSEGMNPLTITNQTFTLKETVSGTAVAGTVSYSGVSAVFDPLNDLASSTRYTATIKGGVNGAKDLAGNPVASDFVWSWTTGAAADITEPSVTGTINANGATGVAVNTNAGATFSEGMNPLTLTNQTFTLKESVSGTAVAGTVSYSGVSAVFNPLNDLANSTRYTATIKGGINGAKDLAGNPLASDYVWSWTTGAAADTTAPTVTGTVNAAGATGVAVNTNDGATFSKAMNPLTLTNLTFTVKETVSGAAVAGTVSYTGVSAVFDPLNDLANSTGYTATIKGGVTGAKDLAGNPVASDFVWSWTTGAAADTTAPTVIQVNPADLLTNIAIDTTVSGTFSKAMNPLSISTATFTLQASGPPLGSLIGGTVGYNQQTKTAIFTPSSPLAANTSYTATITTGATDLAGNRLVANKVWSFTTAALVPAPPGSNLGSAATFGIMATSAITNTGAATRINGDVSLEPGTSNGLLPVQVNGAIHINDTVSHQARADLLAGYNIYKNLPPGTTIGGGADLGALYPGPAGIPPGTYTSGSTMLVSTPLILNAGGNANAVWVFQIGSSLTTTANMSLANGAQAKNVFWVPTFDGTIGVGSVFYGTIISGRDVTGKTGAVINGRILAGATLAGTIALDTNTVNVPAQ
jgi:hypothetical protein